MCYRKESQILISFADLFYNFVPIAGFSIAFGSTGCNGSASGRATFAPLARNVECRRHELLRRVRGHGEIYKILYRLSKMQFPVFPGLEWLTGKVF